MLFLMVLVLIVDTVIVTASVLFDVLHPILLVVWILLASLAVIALGTLGGDMDD